MVSLNMCSGKEAALIAVGAGASFLLLRAEGQAGEESLFPGVTSLQTCIIAGASLLALSWLYKLLFFPLEVLRAPEDVGYIAEDGRSRARAANEVRRRRKVGDLPPVYPNGWYRVLDSHLLERGEVKNVTILGEQVVVFRGLDGKAFVLDAYCSHLGANLAVGGRVVGNCIECPFHGWQFDGNNGKCVKIPYAEKVPEFAKVHRWPSCELNGQILVWFHCDGEEPQWAVPEVKEITKGEWVYRGRTEHFINAHIQAQWEPEPEPNTHCSNMYVKHAITLFGRHWSLLDVSVVARQVGPGLVFLQFEHSFLGRGVMLHCVTPVEPLLQCVTHIVFYQSNIPPVVPNFILMSERIQFERDVMIWNNKKYIAKPLLVKEDSAIQKHRRWFSQFYSENSPRLHYQRDTLDF